MRSIYSFQGLEKLNGSCGKFALWGDAEAKPSALASVVGDAGTGAEIPESSSCSGEPDLVVDDVPPVVAVPLTNDTWVSRLKVGMGRVYKSNWCPTSLAMTLLFTLVALAVGAPCWRCRHLHCRLGTSVLCPTQNIISLEAFPLENAISFCVSTANSCLS